jgi:LacI family transcriptional regulator
MSKVTERVIAEIAGVSVNTVSRALNNKPDVSSITRKKVLKIAKRLGYVPNLLAKSLKSGESKTIGVVVSNLSNPFFNPVLRGIDDKLREKEYNIIICNSDGDYRREEEAIATLIQKRVDGVVLTPVGKRSLDISFLKKARVPFVLMMSHFKVTDTDYVGFNDKIGAFLAAEHLIKKRHRKILYLGGPPYFSLARDRLQGHKKALIAHEIKVDQKLVRAVSPKLEEGYQVVKKTLSEGLDFTAIATFNDYLALGAMKAIFERHLKIPDDIAIVGYDDIEFASLSIVPLTTIRLPKYLLGSKTAGVLLAKMTKKRAKSQRMLLKPELIVRDST